MEKKIRPLKSIKTNEEYEEYKKYLDGYLIEYKWYKSHGKSEARDLIIKKAENYENDSAFFITCSLSIVYTLSSVYPIIIS